MDKMLNICEGFFFLFCQLCHGAIFTKPSPPRRAGVKWISLDFLRFPVVPGGGLCYNKIICQ